MLRYTIIRTWQILFLPKSLIVLTFHNLERYQKTIVANLSSHLFPTIYRCFLLCINANMHCFISSIYCSLFEPTSISININLRRLYDLFYSFRCLRRIFDVLLRRRTTVFRFELSP